LKNLDFKKEQINEIWSVVAAVLLLGNISFDGTLQN
jgi:myosin heavy subunit